jgi:lysophospholipase L1-like esterase
VRAAAWLLAAALGCLAVQAAGLPRGQALAAAPANVLDLGDSLGVGTAPYLRRALRGYRIRSIHDVGLHAYDAAALVARSRAELPRVLVVSAGTNDDPRIVSTFWRAVAEIVAAAGPSRCVVWPTIVRPPAAGASYAGFNRVLARLARRHPNLVLVDWARLVVRHPAWLAGDGVHASAAGYRARAAAIAAAVRFRCRA